MSSCHDELELYSRLGMTLQINITPFVSAPKWHHVEGFVGKDMLAAMTALVINRSNYVTGDM